MYRRNLRRIFGASLALCCLLGALSLGGSAAGDIFVNGSADVLPGGIGSAYAETAARRSWGWTRCT